MIAPLQPIAIQGVIWYQGEANGGRGEFYKELFPTLIRGWRNAWGQGEFPFLYVQLANYGIRQEKPGDAPWARLREAQLASLAVPRTAMAVAIDVGEGPAIHPRNKQEVGRRLALGALAVAYGRELVYSGPLFTKMTVENGTARLYFKHAEGLKISGEGPVKGFAIAGEDRRWVWATATIDRDTVIVSSPEVAAPVAVRYAWGSNPEVNLVNGAGLPASPFRTDDWGVSRR
jgi:sialate O-acetylesterase